MFGFLQNFFGTTPHDNHLDAVVDSAMDGLDIQTAMLAHENWKLRLEACLKGTSSEQFVAEVICFDDHCDLGKWIHGDGKTHLGEFPGFTSLLEHHKMFHYAASNVVTLLKSGKDDEARKMLDGPFTAFSKAVGEDLERMQYVIEHSKSRKHN